MKFAIIVILIVFVVVVVAVIMKASKGININSFWDVVRNPGAMPDLEQFHRDVEDRASEIAGSEEKIAKLVDDFVFEAKSSDDAWTEKRVIAKLGTAAYPRALEILRDESNHQRLVDLSGNEGSLPEAPICRLAEIFDLDTPPPHEAAKLLSPFLRSEASEIRKSVALVIGSLGSSQSLPDLQRALSDENEYVKSYALIGIKRAISGGRIFQTDKAAFYELVAAMWPEDTSYNVCDSIPGILLSLDRARAIERLLQPDLFTVKFKPVWVILKVFATESLDIPRSKLLVLINDASKEPIEYPMSYVLENALHLLGQHRINDDLSTLEKFVNHPNKNVSEGAIKGVYAYHDYFDRIRNPWDVVESHGWDTLTDSEKHICAIEELDGEVNNGGFAQYFFNSSGNHWKDALSGLAAIGATKHHKIMAEAIEKFGQSAPSSAREVRNSQLSKIVRKQEDPFNEQDTAWYKTEDELLARLMFRYNLSNMKELNKSEQSKE